MATTRITEKISRLVSSQLPEFIRTDNTTFVAFLEYYYKFLEQDQGALELVQNSQKYSDIDQTTDSFVNYFITNYAKDLPYNLQVNKPLLIKRVKDLYAAKGGTLSIETLFKILYDTVAQTNHPYDFVLRPSDGKWNLRTSIRVFLTSGSASDIKDRFLTFTKNNINYSVEILRVKNLTTNLYEVFYHSAFPVPFAVNDEVVVSGSNGSIFTGTIRPTTTDWEIRSAGTGFRVGQIFNVSVGSGIDTLVRIDKVNATGGIELLKFLNFGFNFTDDISIILSNALPLSTSLDVAASFVCLESFFVVVGVGVGSVLALASLPPKNDGNEATALSMIDGSLAGDSFSKSAISLGSVAVCLPSSVFHTPFLSFFNGPKSP